MLNTYYLRLLHDDMSLVTFYNVVGVIVVPRVQEALGHIASKNTAGGTPVVAFGATGLLDIIEHQKTGYLAKPFESKDLADGIEWVLNATNYDELSLNAREKVLKEFDSVIVAKKYIRLYEEVSKCYL